MVTPPVRQTKRYVVGAFHILFGILLGLLLTVWKGSADSTGFGFGASSSDWFTIPTVWVNVWVGLVVLVFPLIGIGVYRLMRPVEGRLNTVLTMVAVVCGIVALLLWVGTVEAEHQARHHRASPGHAVPRSAARSSARSRVSSASGRA